MTNRKLTVSFSLIAAVAAMLSLSLSLSSPASAKVKPGKHPHYLHALSDLRYARAWLTALGEANVEANELVAIKNIDNTIADIKSASIDDGKNLNDHPPVDVTLKHKARLIKAIDLLKGAKKDLAFDEDDKKALGWRAKAQKHDEDAIEATKKAIKDASKDAGV